MGNSATQLVCEIGSCWKPGDLTSLEDACKAAFDCGADLVKVQCFRGRQLAMRRGCKPEVLTPWELDYRDVLKLGSKFKGKLGVSFFDPKLVRAFSDHISHAGINLWRHLSFVKSACQEWQWAALAEELSRLSVVQQMSLYVSVPPDATLSVGNYYSAQPITWLYCVPEYPVKQVSPAVGYRKGYLFGRFIKMRDRLPGKLGVSDHTEGSQAADEFMFEFSSIDVWEKHFCYDESLRGECPDGGPWSLSQEDFKRFAEVVHS